MKIRRAIDRISHRGAEVAAIGTAGVGLFALGTWAFGQWRIAAFGPEYVPMAPSTAVLFVLLGLAMGACHRWPEVRPVRIFGMASAIITMVVSALVAAQSWSYFPLPWDGWLTHPDLRAGAIPLGRMSPLTAAAFLLSAASLLARAPGPPVTKLLRWSAAIAAGAALLVGLVVALGYAAGTPLFYGGQTVPMALLTAIAFVALNLGLLLSNGAVSGLLDWLAPGLDSDVSETQRRFVWRLLSILAGLVVVISLTGFFYLKHQQTSARADVYGNLTAIADLKMAQIVDWRNERLSDGRFLLRAPFVAEDVAALLANPGSAIARTKVFGWLNLMKGGDRYERATVLDPTGTVRLAIPEPAEAPAPRLSELLATTLAARELVMTDLHRAEAGGSIHIDLLVPVFPPGDQPGVAAPPSPPPRSAPVAVIVLRLNPERFLFPLIQTWPTPSATAETLLMRREGDEVMFLNELRHRRGMALALRRPVSDSQLPAAMAARGERGMREGVDYRGVPVLSVTRAVPDSPWIMVAKMDQAEAYAPIRAEARRTGLMVGLLLVAVVLAAAYLWRQRHAALLRHELTLERERKALADRLGVVTRYANDIILMLDETGRIVEANDRALATYGYTLDELRQLSPGGLRPPVALENLARQLALFGSTDGALFETVHRRRDGTTFPVEVSGRSVAIEGRQFSLGIYRDITERKQAEQALENSLSLLQATLESTADGLLVVNQTGQMVQFNQKFAEMWRIPADILASHDDSRAIAFVLEQLKDPGSFVAKVKELYAQPDAVSFDVLEFKDGRTFERYSQPQKVDGKSVGRVWSFRDITERKQAEEALRQSARELQEKNAELERFTYAVSHDLKSPLVTIQTFLSYLEQSVRQHDAPRMEEDLAFIRGAAGQMARLLDELLDLSRVGRKMNPPEEVPLQAVVQEALDLVAGRIARRAVQIQVTDEPVRIFGDRPRLVEVFQNLVDNAVKFMGDQPAPRVEIGAESTGGARVFFVRDNGIGIDPRLQSKLFGLFEKLDAKAEGTGLGLALVKRIVEVHGGRIWAESEGAGQGTTFRFTLAGTGQPEQSPTPPIR